MAIWFNATDLASSAVDDEVKEFLKLKTCRAAYLAEKYGHKLERSPQQSGVNCCDNCAAALMPVESTPAPTPAKPNIHLKAALNHYFSSENQLAVRRGEDALSTGLSNGFAEEISKLVITSNNLKEQILDLFPEIEGRILDNILCIIAKFKL